MGQMTIPKGKCMAKFNLVILLLAASLAHADDKTLVPPEVTNQAQAIEAKFNSVLGEECSEQDLHAGRLRSGQLSHARRIAKLVAARARC